MTKRRRDVLNMFAAVWGTAGLSGVLIFAIYRLGRISLAAVEFDWHLWHWIALIANLLFMAYAEGYRGFQRRFSPRSAARAFYLYQHGRLLDGLLAPLFCAGYFAASRRTMLVVWIGTAVIIVLVLMLQQIEQPWRGIIDWGVVVGLTWGVLAFWVMLIQTFSAGRYLYSPDIPGHA
ncbi:MAG: hypothetical protein V3R50_01930 [Gammaproteobacteria bacterium]|jgi:hypothetical protein